MNTFKTTTIKSIIGSSKLIVEVPHQRPAFIYDTNLKMTDFVSERSNNRLRDDLRDNSHYFVMKNLQNVKDAYESTVGHQMGKRQVIIKKWCAEYLTGPQYLFVFGERKSNND